MTTFPTSTAKAAEDDRGRNLIAVRAYNERLILSIVRRHDSLAKADISRMTGLSAQTVSVITRALEADGLLLRMAPQRGRIGQPLVPLKINPQGVYSLGLKIGRRSADLILIDFVGTIRDHLHWTYRNPLPEEILERAEAGIAELTAGMEPEAVRRIAGLGVAMPSELWSWAEDLGFQPEALEAWRGFDIEAAMKAQYPFPVFLSNDGTCACGAELTFGDGRNYQDFIYVFVGSFAGGGVVLGRSLYSGRSGNAGALGSMPVPATVARRAPTQLIMTASLVRLEARLAAAGKDASAIFLPQAAWDGMGETLDGWIEEAARGLAHAIVASVSVIDFEAAIVDGGFPAGVRARLVERTRARLSELDVRGLSPFQVVEGTIGANARAIGAATLPLFARYLLDRDLLFRQDA